MKTNFLVYKYMKIYLASGRQLRVKCTVTLWRHRFSNVALSEILAGNSFSVGVANESARRGKMSSYLTTTPCRQDLNPG